MKRLLEKYIRKDLSKKVILISGPRQCGKTTLSKQISSNYQYLNYDLDEHRVIIENKEWDRTKEIIIFDELHKMPKWKNWLKGIYDVYGTSPQIIVTGSAKLDTFRKVGDSLAGRYYLFHLMPFDMKENFLCEENFNVTTSLNNFLEVGGFPEPYLAESIDEYRRWKKTHLDIILRQDLITLEKVTNIIGIEKLIRLLRQRVGSTISHKNLADDIGVDPKTIKNWLSILESLYVIFKITPYSKKIKNSLLKAPKYYFYDNGQVEGDNGNKLENLVALSLLKELHFLSDTKGIESSLHFIRNKFGDEIDFLVIINNQSKLALEVKWSNDSFASSFFKYEKELKSVDKIQISNILKNEKTHTSGIELRSAATWLAQLDLSKYTS